MGIYSNLNGSWTNLMEKIGLRGITSKIDKVIPSMILFVIILIALIFLIVFLAIPTSKQVEFEFLQNGERVSDDIYFSVQINDSVENLVAKSGHLEISLPYAESIEIIGLEDSKYSLVDSVYSMEEYIGVELERFYSDIPVTIYLYDDLGTSFEGSGNLAYSCSNTNDSGNVSITSNSVIVDVPQNCGVLSINTSTDGFLERSTTCTSTTCQVNLEAIGNNSNDNPPVPSGSVLVDIYGVDGSKLEGATIKVFAKSNMQDAIISTTSNSGTFTQSSLVAQDYILFVSKEGYSTAQKEFSITENNQTSLQVNMSLSPLGSVRFNFYSFFGDEQGIFTLRDLEGNVVHSADVGESGSILVPVPEYDVNYTYDFMPQDGNIMPVTLQEIVFTSSLDELDVELKEIENFEVSWVNIQVVDESDEPIYDAKVFVQDKLTGFELLSYSIPRTDENGETSVLLEKGSYLIRAQTAVSEGYSSPVIITETKAGKNDIPEVFSKVKIAYGYGLLDLTFVDEFGLPISYSTLSLYSKQEGHIGDMVLGENSKLENYSIRAGRDVYFKFFDDDGYYEPFISSARFILKDSTWQETIEIDSLSPNNSPNATFLGIFKSPGSDEITTINTGEAYYAGYDLMLNGDAQESDYSDVEFKLMMGEANTNVEQDAFYISEIYAPTLNIERFSDASSNNLTLSDTKIANVIFDNPENGRYRIYFKFYVRDDLSSSKYDNLKLNWSFYADSPINSQTDIIQIGGNSLCNDNSFCYNLTVLDVEEDLYVNSIENLRYSLTPNKSYILEFDLINGLEGAKSNIERGRLQIFNGVSDTTSREDVLYNASENNMIATQGYNLVSNTSGESESLGIHSGSQLYGIFADVNFEGFNRNDFIEGSMNIIPVSSDPSYINYTIIDRERLEVVSGKSAMSILVEPREADELDVVVEPNILVPNTAQNATIKVTDSLGDGVYGAKVVILIKSPRSMSYTQYANCTGTTNELGEYKCTIKAEDTSLNTRFQVNVQKEGYAPYYHNDAIADFKVSDRIIDSEPQVLELNLTYPDSKEAFADATFINYSSSDLILENIDIDFDRASEPFTNYLDVDVMRNYVLNIFENKYVLGRDDESPEGIRTVFDRVFKAKINENNIPSVDGALSISGMLKLEFKTHGSALLEQDIPFKVSITSDGYPTNSSDCLRFEIDESFSSNSRESIIMPITMQNTCSIANNSGMPYPTKFDDLKVVITPQKGSLALGSFSSINFPNKGYSSTNIIAGVATSIGSNVETDFTTPTGDGTLSFIPLREGESTYSIKLVGVVNGNQVESPEVDFSITVIDLQKCLSVYDSEGSKVNSLELDVHDGDVLEDSYKIQKFRVENECENIPIKVRACLDNSGKRTLGCGKTTGDPIAGIEILTTGANEVGGALIEEGGLDIEFERPDVPGAYSISLWAKRDSFDVSMQRVTELKVNAKTSPKSGFYSDEPFLELDDDDEGKKYSQVLNLYNKPINKNPLHSITNKDIYKNIIKEGCEEEKEGVCFEALEDIVYSGRQSVASNATGNTLLMGAGLATFVGGVIPAAAEASNIPGAVGFAEAFASAAGWLAAGPGLAVAVTSIVFAIASSQMYPHNAAIMYTTGGAAAGVSGATMVGLAAFGGSACASVVGCALGGSILLAASVTWLVQAAFMDTMTQDDFTQVLMINSEEPETNKHNFLDDDDFNLDIKFSTRDVLAYTGEDKYYLINHRKEVKASTAMTSKTWDESIDFSEKCPSGYEVDYDGIQYLEREDKEQDDGDELDITFDNCSWNSPPELVEGREEVKFDIKCSAGPFKGLTFESYALLPCRPKDEQWERMQTKGVSAGESGSGHLKYKFTSVEPKCDEEWCYYTYNFENSPEAFGVFGELNDYYRVAFKNLEYTEPQIESIATKCTDASGAVVGYTGPEAKPKIEYNWDLDEGIDENTCFAEDDESIYCDSTQFLGFAIKRANIGMDKIDELMGSKTLKCPGSDERTKFINTPTIVQDTGEILGVHDPKVTFDGDNNEQIKLVVPLRADAYPKDTEFLHSATYGGQDAQVTCSMNVQDTVGDLIDARPQCTILLDEKATLNGMVAELEQAQEGYVQITQGQATLTVNLGEENETLIMDVNSYMEKLPPMCAMTNPTTADIGGEMGLTKFISDQDYNKEAFFESQDYFHFQTYLMEDGFGADFLEDFANSCDDFLSCPDGFDPYLDAIREGRFAIINTGNLNTKTNGPGLYNVHTIIEYPNIEEEAINWADVDNNDLSILISIEKVKNPEYDSIFYYLPIDGKVGYDGSKLDRQGYGSAFMGDTLDIAEGVTTNMGAGSSNALKTINVSRGFDFVSANTTKRGSVLSANVSEDVVNLDIVDNMYWDSIRVNLKPIDKDTRTVFAYTLSVDGKKVPAEVALPWYHFPNYEYDFSGEPLSDNYPRIGQRISKTDGLGSDVTYTSKLEFTKEFVTQTEPYSIYTRVFNSGNGKVDIEKATTLNLKDNNVIDETDEKSISFEKLDDLFEEIEDETLCIGGTSTKTNVFYNEEGYQ